MTLHVEAHLDDTLRVADLAKLIGLGPRRFSSAFRGSFGRAPHDYLLWRRIRRACELMLMTQEPLGQIAILCGFADQAHLTHVFRARIGVPPNTWRRPQRDDQATAASAFDCIGVPGREGMPSRRTGFLQAHRGSPRPRPEDGGTIGRTGIGVRPAIPSAHGLSFL